MFATFSFLISTLTMCFTPVLHLPSFFSPTLVLEKNILWVNVPLDDFIKVFDEGK